MGLRGKHDHHRGSERAIEHLRGLQESTQPSVSRVPVRLIEGSRFGRRVRHAHQPTRAGLQRDASHVHSLRGRTCSAESVMSTAFAGGHAARSPTCPQPSRAGVQLEISHAHSLRGGHAVSRWRLHRLLQAYLQESRFRPTERERGAYTVGQLHSAAFRALLFQTKPVVSTAFAGGHAVLVNETCPRPSWAGMQRKSDMPTAFRGRYAPIR